MSDLVAARPSLLDQVLPKLRPFQREALEFATEGKLYKRQCADEDTTSSTGASLSSAACTTTDESLLGKGRILLADEMGLGKTVTSLAIMAYYEPEWPLLILCPASLRYTWPAEIEKFFPSISPQSIYVVSGFCDIAFTKRKDVRIVVVTYSLLQDRSAVAKVLEDQNFNCIIADESHNLKQKNSQRAKKILPILRRSRRLVLLSGTPALARPVELWTQLSCFAPKLFGNWTTFTNRYCDPQKKRIGGRVIMDFSGASNAPELHQKLKNVMVRRLKCNVLAELPPKQRSLIPTAISRDEKENCKRAIKEMGDKRASLSELFGDAARQADFEAKSKMMKAYQQSGIGKAQAVADYVVDWLAGSETLKILVFAHHKAVLDTVDQRLLAKCPNSHIRIDGSVAPALRTQLVRKFQTCSRVRVALLSMTAAGVGLTMTAASTVLFAELHWTPGVLAQAEDRAHRIGQTHDSVQVVYMVCKDQSLSLDMSMWRMLGKKIGTLGQVVDGSEDKPYIYAAEDNVKNLPSSSTNRGKSVQDEVSSFFAEAVAEESHKASRGPVKGSIQSFFRKAPPKHTPSKSTQDDTRRQSASRELAPSASREAAAAKVSFVCDVCTFENVMDQPKSEWVPCEMCGNLHKASKGGRGGGDDELASAPASKSVSRRGSSHGTSDPKPPSKRAANVRTEPKENTASSPSDKVKWVCQTCTVENMQPRTSSGWYACMVCDEQRLYQQDAGVESDSEDSLLASTPAFDRSRTEPKRVSTERRATLRPSRDSNEAEIVVIDSPERDARSSSKVATSSVSKSSSSEVIEIDDSDDEALAEKSIAATRRTHTLTFSVSKNSGRITIHFADTGDSSLVNFEVEQVVTADTADRLLDNKVAKRRHSGSVSSAVIFNDSGVKDILDKLVNARRAGEPPDAHPAEYAKELKTFVGDYLSLREVQKKALKDSGQALPAERLAQATAGLMASSFGGTERYSGGAKERARENLDNGNATAADVSVLDGKACAWCSKPLHFASVTSGSVYCSQVCAEEGRLRRGGMYASTRVRAAVFALEGGKCSMCEIDAQSLFEQVRALEPAERLNKLLSVNWKLPKSSKAMDSLLNNPKEGDFWQADHMVAVAEGGGACGLDNLRTLCAPCHLLETEKLRQRLRLKSPPRKDGEVSKRRQVDIRSAFFGSKDSSLKRQRK